MKTNFFITLMKSRAIISLTIAVYLINLLMVNAQTNNYYHASVNGSGITAATGQSGISKLNCDVRAIGSGTLSVISWDGTSPSYKWIWTNGASTYSGTISLPSNALAPDISILYDYDVDHDKAAIVVIYEQHQIGNNQLNYVHYATWKYNNSNHTVSVLDAVVDINISTDEWNCAAIDGETRGSCAMAWVSNGDLHSIAGSLVIRFGDIAVDWGMEKTLNLPTISNCPDIMMPDVAIFSSSNNPTYHYIYYSYLRCGIKNLCEQTQHFDDIHDGSGVPSVWSSHYETVAGDANFAYPRIAANQYFTLGGGGNGAQRNEFTIVAH
jgi:hypothetical protein